MSAKCYWSVFILERIFSPPLSNLPETGRTPDYPTSSTLPHPVQTASNHASSSDLLDTEETIRDVGINTYCIKMISVWGKIALYLQEIRYGQVEAPWLAHSTHTKLCVELFECEAQLSQRHLLRNVAFSQRSLPEILAQQDYWRPWITMQVISHAAPAVLNHPFLHLSAIPGKVSASRSRLFLQQTVDLALFHSGWVFRLIQICEDLTFEVNDPIVGHLVAATATIPWFYQFAGDCEVAKKAGQDVHRCKALLGRLSIKWPHIQQKVREMRNLCP